MRSDTSSIHSPSIGVDMVHYIARLVRLEISTEQAEVFSQQFSQIIEYFQMLNEVDTREVKPAYENTSLKNIFREDVVSPSMSRKEFLDNAPQQEGPFVKIPGI
jgi:aspartyl-tRNA(Asn)/glutamyl-tRNA(Gln) amidotransferase subunit C